MRQRAAGTHAATAAADWNFVAVLGLHRGGHPSACGGDLAAAVLLRRAGLRPKGGRRGRLPRGKRRAAGRRRQHYGLGGRGCPGLPQPARRAGAAQAANRVVCDSEAVSGGARSGMNIGGCVRCMQALQGVPMLMRLRALE